MVDETRVWEKPGTELRLSIFRGHGALLVLRQGRKILRSWNYPWHGIKDAEMDAVMWALVGGMTETYTPMEETEEVGA